jgi:hypothetical protein
MKVDACHPPAFLFMVVEGWLSIFEKVLNAIVVNGFSGSYHFLLFLVGFNLSLLQ